MDATQSTAHTRTILVRIGLPPEMRLPQGIISVFCAAKYAKKAADDTDNADMDRVQFEAELIEGHKGVTVVLVPFDPEERWSRKPVRLDGRRHGWLISGSANGVAFDGYIGERWNRFFIIIDDSLRAAAKVAVGDTVKMIVEPTSSARALAQARQQSKKTTAPKQPRADAIDPPED